MTGIKDDASLYWQSRHANVQDFEQPEPPTFVNLDEDQESDLPENVSKEVTNKEVRSQLNMLKLNEPTAQIVTDLMDSLLPVIFILIIKGTNEDHLKLTNNERETLTNAWAQYLKDSNMQMSPGIVLLGTIGIIYGSKITLALSDRKKQKKLGHQEKKIESLETKIKELEKSKNDEA